GQRSLPPSLILHSETEAVCLRNPFRSGQEDLALVLIFRDEHTIQAYVIHDHTMRKVLDRECDQIRMTVSLYSQNRGDDLTGSDGQFKRFAGARNHLRRAFAVRFE